MGSLPSLVEVVVLCLGLVAVLLVAGMSGRLPPRAPAMLFALPAGAQGATPEQLTPTASRSFAAALSDRGITFEVVQTSTIVAREGGPLVELPDPNDRSKSRGEAERLVLGTLVERGMATPDGFWSELLHGPRPGAEPWFDVDQVEAARQALVRDGRSYRNDGQGWHYTISTATRTTSRCRGWIRAVRRR